MFDRFRPTLTGIAATLLWAIASPSKALEVKISPQAPQLGDTISVMVTTDDPTSKPTVKVNQQEQPLFKINDQYRAFIPTSPLNSPGKMTVEVAGDNSTSNVGVWLKNRVFPVQRITLTGSAARPATQLELDRVTAFKNLVTPQKFWQGAFLRPNASRISTGFGVRRYYNNVFAEDYYHKGVDYAGGYGSPVVAPAAGQVRLVGREDEGFHVHGNVIGIDHGQGVLSIFLHLQDLEVTEGEMVKAGQRIGTIGDTGASAGPHLHWGLYVNQVSVDPVPWRFGAIE
ncbi:MAG: M23 family metallopeptidase [Pleurocapsa minor HA4230-MV1]|jgi:murein DD-endopeptidase MepM/ murein hydrolase activator NlpD|nr:M23 family metallopeptidase [Pleurocapsa minor HA4230-MV1]